MLESTIIPALVQRHASGSPIRVWIVGCSTGEEAYSLVMLFREALAEAKLHIKLQVFASDVDPGSVAFAREGQYPESIADDVSPARLARFFSRENGHYVVSPDLRSAVVFTVQDILADAPFSRLDMVSCRNLLIYLRPDAQAKVISLLHFALAIPRRPATQPTVSKSLQRPRKSFAISGTGGQASSAFSSAAMAEVSALGRIMPRNRRGKRNWLIYATSW
jgi:hypothetical protein